MKPITEEKWRVAQPGTHGKTLRVVQDIGVSVDGKEIAGAVCEISTSRSSEDGFSDATEQARAHLIAASPMLLEALKLLKERLHEYVKLDVRKHAYLLIADAAAGTAIAKAEGKL